MDFAIDYINGFIDYINDLDMDFLSVNSAFGLTVFGLYFPAKEDAMVFYWKYENGNYSYNTHFDDTYDLETDVNEFLEYNDIFLRRLPK